MDDPNTREPKRKVPVHLSGTTSQKVWPHFGFTPDFSCGYDASQKGTHRSLPVRTEFLEKILERLNQTDKRQGRQGMDRVLPADGELPYY